ncbi:MAG: PIG-L family deacetylase, partial [Paracoccaceae bacterium]
LGTLRTREMEHAAQVLGITQYWLSTGPDDTIFDFGFSKSGDETLAHWGEERTLQRFVTILRDERPDIVCPTFLDIPGQHGHHRAMTRAAFKAVVLAADPAAFADIGLPAWQVKKLYLPAWSGAGDSYDDDVPPPRPTVNIDGTGSDPVLGADYAQIAQWSRAFHKSQGMGRWSEPGLANIWPLHMAWSVSGETRNESSVLEGLPATLNDLAGFAGAPEIHDDLSAAQAAIEAAIGAFPHDQRIVGHALKALDHIAQARASCPAAAQVEVEHRLRAKERQLTHVIALASGIGARLWFSDDTVRPGGSLTLSLDLHAPGFEVTSELVLPQDWQATKWQNGTCEVTIPPGAAPGNPYPDRWFPDRANSPVYVKLVWHVGDQRLSMPVEPEERLQILPR